MRGWASVLGGRAIAYQPDSVCGPLTGGAFIAQSLAAQIDAGFVFAERLVPKTGWVRYSIPDSLRGALRGRRVLLVDDVVNAGSTLLATLADLQDCHAVLAGFATLLTLGEAASQIAERHGAPLFMLASLDRGMWAPEECSLCRSGVPLIDHLSRW